MHLLAARGRVQEAWAICSHARHSSRVGMGKSWSQGTQVMSHAHGGLRTRVVRSWTPYDWTVMQLCLPPGVLPPEPPPAGLGAGDVPLRPSGGSSTHHCGSSRFCSTTALLSQAAAVGMWCGAGQMWSLTV